MVTYSRQFLDNVKKQVNMLELAGRYTKLEQRNPTTWIGKCPHPDHKDSHPSFRIWYENNEWSWACMACHAGKKDVSHKIYGSDCFAFIQWMSDYSASKHVYTWPEAVQFILDLYHIPLEKNNETIRIEKLQKEMRAHEQRVSDVKEYLYQRGLSNNDIKSWHIGYDGHRIVFPIFDTANLPVGFSKRKYGNDIDGPKYMTSFNFVKSNYLYGQHDIQKNYPYIFIAEGVFDVILARKYGIPNVVCGLGCSLSDAQVERIQRWQLTPVLCFDNDPAGLKGIRSALEKFLTKNIYGRILVLPKQSDLADTAILYKEKLTEYVQTHMQTYWEYILSPSVKAYQMQMQELKRRALPMILAAKKSVQTEEESIIFSQYIQEQFQIQL